MTFLHPWLLLLIIPAIFLLRRKKDRTPVPVASLQLWPDLKAGRARYLWLPILLRHLSILLLIVALARPQAGTTHTTETKEGIAIELLVDISSSMDMSIKDAAGTSSTRLEVAREMVSRFIAGDGETLKGRPDDLIGLITFARYADTRSPLTSGHDALLQIIENLEIQSRPNEDGTAYGDALAIAAARLRNPQELKETPIASRVIILLTDGENNSGAHLPEEAAGLAKKWDCRIYAISLGDEGTDTLSPAEKILQHISEKTGGIFRQARDYESLLSVYSEIDTLERTKFTTRSSDHTAELLWLPLTLSLVTLLSALTLEATYLRVVP